MFANGIKMEGEGTEVSRKRMKPAMEDKVEDPTYDETTQQIVEEEATEKAIAGSEEMELNISHILEKIERFTNMVSELLESGRTMFKELSDEFEERLITIHKEQMEKWQDEIRELRLLDASNEEAVAVLHNASFLFQSSHLSLKGT